MDRYYKRAVLGGYIEAAHFFNTEEGDERGTGLAPSAWIQAARTVLRFLSLAEGLLLPSDSPRKVGVDLWLTQDGHGAGFWDGDYDDRGDHLTRITHSLGRDIDIYTGDDGLVYFI
jgi:hypothetical protein